MAAEGYAETSGGLFPRFVIASSVFAALGLLVTVVQGLILRWGAGSPLGIGGANLYEGLVPLIGVAYSPFLLFFLFYLTSRIRVVLDRDYARVALSIFLGALIVELIANVVLEDPWNSFNAYTPLGYGVQVLGYSVGSAAYFAVVGFSAAMLSYLRRL